MMIIMKTITIVATINNNNNSFKVIRVLTKQNKTTVRRILTMRLIIKNISLVRTVTIISIRGSIDDYNAITITNTINGVDSKSNDISEASSKKSKQNSSTDSNDKNSDNTKQ